jgi:hypothetical protein
MSDNDWSKQVAAIDPPTMLVFANADPVRPEHIVEFFSVLGGGEKDARLDGSGRPRAQLAILSGSLLSRRRSRPSRSLFSLSFRQTSEPLWVTGSLRQ